MDEQNNNLKQRVKKVAKKMVRRILLLTSPVFLFIFLIIAIWYVIESLVSIEIATASEGELTESTSIAEDGSITVSEEAYENIRKALKDKGINPEVYWLGEKDFVEGTDTTYLEKMVYAEIVSSYPDTGVGDVRGIVKIQRNNEDITYKSKADFEALLEGSQGTDDIKKYFTLDDEMNLIVATASGEQKSFNYKKLVSQYSVPFEFLFTLMQTTKNPEYVAKMADLVLEESEIILTIYDTETTTETTTEVTWEDVLYSGETRSTTAYNYNVPLNFKSRTSRGPETTTETETLYSVSLKVSKVKTWVYDKNVTYEKETTSNTSEAEPKVEEKITGEVITDKSKDGDEYVVKKTRTDIENRTTTITMTTTSTVWKETGESTEEINTDRFLGLWKNDTGEYEQGALYNADGAIVYYDVPKENIKRSPAKFITDMPQFLFDLLSNSEDTQNIERIMRYILYVYTGKDYGVTNPEELLDFFKPVNLSSSSATSLVEYIFKYINDFEGSTPVVGDCYQAIDAGDGAITIGHGMTNYEIPGIKAGDLLPIAEVDEKEKDFIRNSIEEARTRFPDMPDNQIVAVVAFHYNAGNQTYVSKGYHADWKEERDNKYFEGITEEDIPNLEKQWDLINSRSGGTSDSACAYNESILTQLKALIDTPLYTNYWGGYCHGSYYGRRITYGGLLWRRWAEFLMFQYGYNTHDRTFFNLTGSLANWEGEVYVSAQYTVPVYNQYNGPWASERYGRFYPEKTIASSGCGCCSISAIISAYLGQAYTPNIVKDYLDEYYPDGRYYVYGVGSTGAVYASDFLYKYFGCTSEYVRTTSQAEEALRNGYCVIGGEKGHVLAFVPVSDEDAANGYLFRVIDSARGHNYLFASFADTWRGIPGGASPSHIIYPPGH